MFIDHTFHIIGDAVKKEMRNSFNRDNWDCTRLLKIYFFIIFCTCKIDTVFTRACGMKCPWLHSLPGYFLRATC